MKSKSSFYLKKWYLDVTAEDGRTLICYAAHLHWYLFKVSYGSYIYRDALGETQRDSHFRETQEPLVQGDLIGWQDAKFGIKGSWTKLTPAVQCRIHDAVEGQVDWHCHQPAAQVQVQFKNEAPLLGMGYVECLEMSLPPWKMEFSTLRWGRFAHAEAPLIWIEMRGNPDRVWVFEGQNLIKNARIAENRIELPDQNKVLCLENPIVLENTDKIRETVDLLMAWIPGIDRFTPLNFLQAEEKKWCSEGILYVDGVKAYSGKVIHELVEC